MTGIERLRKLSEDMLSLSLWVRLTTGTEKDWDCHQGDGRTVNDELLSIADQIERERACDADTIENIRLIVGGVVTDMERHVSGVEGMEDSPVARWARELRAALGGDRRDRAADVSVSAYDLLPEEDREAIAWVRKHGGLEEVEAHWSGRVPLTSVKRMVALHKAKRERLKAHALGLERKCAERGETIRELSGKAAKQSDEIRVMRDVIVETCARLGVEGTGSTVDDAQVIWREISRRLVPEGMEWPRYEDGEPVNLGDRYECWCGKTHVVSSVSVRKGCSVLNASDEAHTFVVSDGPLTSHGKRVKRPVLASDGEPLEVGQTVWHVSNGIEFTVISLLRSGEYQAVKLRLADGSFTGLNPNQLTHQRPVLDADGVLIKVGDTVYKVGENYPPFVVDRLPEPGAYRSVKVVYPSGVFTSLDPERLTHTKPESIDTWERIEEDAKKETCAYFGVEGGGYGCSECPVKQWEESCDEVKSSDLVRRCKALAEKENGNE